MVVVVGVSTSIGRQALRSSSTTPSQKIRSMVRSSLKLRAERSMRCNLAHAQLVAPAAVFIHDRAAIENLSEQTAVPRRSISTPPLDLWQRVRVIMLCESTKRNVIGQAVLCYLLAYEVLI